MSNFTFFHDVFCILKSFNGNISVVVCSFFEVGLVIGCIGFNVTLTAKVISWQSVTHMCFLAFSHQSHQLLFSHASAEMRGENTPERKFASTGDQTHNHQVMSLTHSPLSHTGRALNLGQSQSGVLGKELTLSQTSPRFLHVIVQVF